MAGDRPDRSGGINEEFEAIVSGLELPLPDGAFADDGPSDEALNVETPHDEVPPGDARPNRAVPDGEASNRDPRGDAAPEEGADAGAAGDGSDKRVEVSLLLPGLDNVEAIAAVCRLSGVAATCVPSDIGVIVVLADASYAASQHAAGSFSALLRAVPVVLLRRGPSDDPSDSDVQASRWLGGSCQEPLAPGLILAQAPDVIEGLILGDASYAQQPGSLETAKMSRLKATRILAALLRRQGRAGPSSEPGSGGAGGGP